MTQSINEPAKSYLDIDGNKTVAPSAERQAEIEAAAGESEDAFDISSPAKAQESLRPGLIMLMVHAGLNLLIGGFAIMAALPAITSVPVVVLSITLAALVPVIIPIVLTALIHRHSRIASIAALVWVALMSLTPLATALGGAPLGALMPLLFNAAMATTLAWATMANFAWHRFQTGELARPDVFE